MALNEEPKLSFGESFGQVLGSPSAISAIGTDLLDVFAPARTSQTSTVTDQTKFGEAGIQQFILRALEGEGGYAAIQSGEAASGGFGSSAAALMQANLFTDLATAVAEKTAPKVTTEQQTGKKKKSVVCTQLHDTGQLELDLYQAGNVKFAELSPYTVLGYHSWGIWFAEKMKTSARFNSLGKSWALARYNYVLHNKWSFKGFLTVWVGQPICHVIGRILAALGKGKEYGI